MCRERDVGYIGGFPTCRERDVGHIEGIPTCRERDVGYIEGFPTCRERDVGYIEGIPTCRERDVGHIEGFPTCRERDVGYIEDAQIRDKARSSPAVGLLRALWTHFASAPFSAPVAGFRGGGNHAAHYQAVTAAQRQGPGGVGSVGYVEVAGHEGLFDLGLDCLRGQSSSKSLRSK